MISHWEFILRICLSAVLGSIIGLERERVLWVAGLRTHMLVCVGACLIMLTSAYGFSDLLGVGNAQLDPSRVAAQVVSGIGFLGAGVILLRGEVIHGLTTAASIWVVAGLGLAVGGGLYIGAVFTTFIILLILIALQPLEKKIKIQKIECFIQFQLEHEKKSAELIKKAMAKFMEYVAQLIIQPDASVKYDNVTIILTNIDKNLAVEAINKLRYFSGLNPKKINTKFSESYSGD